jgi:hypothetical protein
MGMLGSSWKDDEEDMGKPGFGSFKEPSLKERYQSLTGDNSEGLSKQEMIDRLRGDIISGYESLKVLGKMSDLEQEIQNSL